LTSRGQPIYQVAHHRTALLSEGLSSGKDPPAEDLIKVARHVTSSHSILAGLTADQWKEKYTDIFGSIPLELPPFREVNHKTSRKWATALPGRYNSLLNHELNMIIYTSN
jgi:hypothetical protein